MQWFRLFAEANEQRPDETEDDDALQDVHRPFL